MTNQNSHHEHLDRLALMSACPFFDPPLLLFLELLYHFFCLLLLSLDKDHLMFISPPQVPFLGTICTMKKKSHRELSQYYR